MATMNISLPDTMKEFVEAEVAQGGYSTASEYFRDLVRDAQKQKAQERLEALLLEGLDSGPSVEVTADYIRHKRDDLIARIEENKKRGA